MILLFLDPCLSFVVPLALLFLAWFSWPCRFTVQRIEERKVLECAIKRREIANAYNSNWRHKGFSINPRSDMTRDRPRFDYLVPSPSDFYVCSFIADSTLSVRSTKPLFHSGLYFAPWKRFYPALSVICFAANFSRALLMHRSTLRQREFFVEEIVDNFNWFWH